VSKRLRKQVREIHDALLEVDPRYLDGLPYVDKLPSFDEDDSFLDYGFTCTLRQYIEDHERKHAHRRRTLPVDQLERLRGVETLVRATLEGPDGILAIMLEFRRHWQLRDVLQGELRKDELNPQPDVVYLNEDFKE